MTQEAPCAPVALAEQIATRYSHLPHVQAVALAGSQTTGNADEKSDIDMYVYVSEPVPLADRAGITGGATVAEIGNEYWEAGDEWEDPTTGIHVDVMFRDVRWIEDHLRGLLDEHRAWVGYTTCLWHNVRTSRPLFDREGWFARLQKRAAVKYPEPLVRVIVAKNHPILRRTLSSYRYQLRRAVERGDRVSINHRVAAVLASYFDILFAVNRTTHPGEKRLVEYALARCDRLPEGMAGQVGGLLDAGEDVIERLDALVAGLDGLLQAEGLL